MRDDIFVNGIYETTSGKIFVYLGYFEGIQIDKEHGTSKVKGHMYWDVTERYGDGGQIYKKAFHSDLATSFNDVDNNKGKVVILKNKKTSLVNHIGFINEVMPNNGIEYQNMRKVLKLKRIK